MLSHENLLIMEKAIMFWMLRILYLVHNSAIQPSRVSHSKLLCGCVRVGLCVCMGVSAVCVLSGWILLSQKRKNSIPPFDGRDPLKTRRRLMTREDAFFERDHDEASRVFC